MRLIFSFFILSFTLCCNETKPVSQKALADTYSITKTQTIKKNIDSSQVLHLKFAEIEVIFDSLKLWDYEKDDVGQLQNINGDSITVFIDLGDDLQQQTFSLKYSKIINDIKIEQSYMTSMSIQGEGPHLDLIDWKHYQSDWKTINKISNDNNYKCLSYSESEQTLFPEVTLEDVKNEIIETENHKEWLSYLDNKYPFGTVMISHYFIKISGIDKKTGKKILKTIIFEMAMGC